MELGVIDAISHLLGFGEGEKLGNFLVFKGLFELLEILVNGGIYEGNFGEVLLGKV